MVTIEVTQRHIDEGVRGECSLCPVAKATSDVFPEYGVKVLHGVIQLNRGNEEWTYQIPVSAFNFVFDFDGRLEVEPFSFTLPDHDLNGKPTPEART